MRKKLISVVTPTFNEADNVREVYLQVKKIFEKLPQYKYEHIFIDNASTDNTVHILRGIASIDKNVKVIINSRNFGWMRSPQHGLLQASGDAIILLVADLQDPPQLIVSFLEKWEEGYKVVKGVKTNSNESFLMKNVRRIYYRFINNISEIELTKDFTGFGLYDRRLIDIMKKIDDPYPYFRGLISEIGFEHFKIEYTQRSRKRGFSSSNLYRLYDVAILGITSHSKIPLRLATFSGFILSGLSLLVSIGYFIAKLLFWNTFSMGMAPVVVGLFFFFSVQLFFIGILGEYVGFIHTHVLKRPLVVEKARINF